MITGRIIGPKTVINGKSADAVLFRPEPSADIYYEVVRIIDARFLFLSDHLRRLERSLQAVGLDYPGDDFIRESLRLLVSESGIQSGNIRISVLINPDLSKDLVVHFVSHFYPTDHMYQSGVDLLTFKHTRPRPGIKKWDGSFRERINEFISRERIYEAVLLNENRCITEGSRSNIFFINRDDHVITAPLDIVLAGITRGYVLKILKSLTVNVEERAICMDRPEPLNASFLSGTSPKVLPVRSIDHLTFATDHPLLREIIVQFGKLLEQSLETL